MLRAQKCEVHKKEDKKTVPKAKIEIRKKNKMAIELCQKKETMATFEVFVFLV
jgi:hypothetical protein